MLDYFPFLKFLKSIFTVVKLLDKIKVCCLKVYFFNNSLWEDKSISYKRLEHMVYCAGTVALLLIQWILFYRAVETETLTGKISFSFSPMWVAHIVVMNLKRIEVVSMHFCLKTFEITMYLKPLKTHNPCQTIAEAHNSWCLKVSIIVFPFS